MELNYILRKEGTVDLDYLMQKMAAQRGGSPEYTLAEKEPGSVPFTPEPEITEQGQRAAAFNQMIYRLRR